LIKKLIEEKVNRCKYSLFIFDEMDKMPILLVDVLKQYINLNSQRHYKNSIFMFLSNSAAAEIKQKSLELEHSNNMKRENFELKMFRRIIENKIFEEKKKVGEEDKRFWHLNLIKAQLIDYFIPLLPLRREHVKLCIKSELKNEHNLENNEKITDEFVNEIADELHYEPPDVSLYSQTGCKRIPQLIRLKLEDMRSKKEL
jgi:torsin-1